MKIFDLNASADIRTEERDGAIKCCYYVNISIIDKVSGKDKHFSIERKDFKQISQDLFSINELCTRSKDGVFNARITHSLTENDPWFILNWF